MFETTSVLPFVMLITGVALAPLSDIPERGLAFEEGLSWFLGTPTVIPQWVIMAVFLYWTRRNNPTAYGCIEIIAGLVALALLVQTREVALLSRVIGFLGGIYIIVRGMDNFEKGLPPGKLRNAWEKYFSK